MKNFIKMKNLIHFTITLFIFINIKRVSISLEKYKNKTIMQKEGEMSQSYRQKTREYAK